MTDRPLISVVTPTFNRAAYVTIAIDSVLAQTYGHFEMIVVDDGSTDDTPSVMERYSDDSRIRYYRQANQGQSVARNVGIEHSRGEYICFLDSDNAWLPEKLEQSLAAFAANPDAGVVYGDCITIDAESTETSRHNMRRHSGEITAALLRDNFVSMNTTMSRAELIRAAGGFDPKDRLAEDYGLWLRVSTRATFVYVPEYWAYYRIMEEQISSGRLARLDANEQVYRSFLAEYGDTLSGKDIRRGWCALNLRRARRLSKNGQTLAALRVAVRAIRLRPMSSVPWRVLMRVALDRAAGGR